MIKSIVKILCANKFYIFIVKTPVLITTMLADFLSLKTDMIRLAVFISFCAHTGLLLNWFN